MNLCKVRKLEAELKIDAKLGQSHFNSLQNESVSSVVIDVLQDQHLFSGLN